jgi:hypothetical protein
MIEMLAVSILQPRKADILQPLVGILKTRQEMTTTLSMEFKVEAFKNMPPFLIPEKSTRPKLSPFRVAPNDTKMWSRGIGTIHQ